MDRETVLGGHQTLWREAGWLPGTHTSCQGQKKVSPAASPPEGVLGWGRARTDEPRPAARFRSLARASLKAPQSLYWSSAWKSYQRVTLSHSPLIFHTPPFHFIFPPPRVVYCFHAPCVPFHLGAELLTLPGTTSSPSPGQCPLSPSRLSSGIHPPFG